ncbi:hypothetical protein [Neisseria iguanae]|uniref:hypothetical protein n=1 Tax=Neisseria iguanae TaxID=90242 RepID=UPI0014748FB5|nr:hypothetical protein [Neisseria iguanae]
MSDRPDFQKQFPYIDVHVVASNRKADLIADGFDVVVRVVGCIHPKFSNQTWD